jgi:nucleoside-diphosphate-sugar epimerase
MKKVLVTGAAGFIASKVCTQLCEQGIEVVGIDNVNDYYDVKLKHHRLNNLEKFKNFTFYKIDIEDRVELAKLFNEYQFDVVFNLAARAGVRYSMENPHIYMTTNAMGSLNLLEEMRKHDVKKFILASTSSLYAGQKMPFSEELAVNTPISPYAASKKAAEVMAYSYHYLYGIDVSIVRYFTVYGPAGRPDMSIFRFIKWIDEGKKLELFGDGGQSRDFTYVDDIAAGTILASKRVGFEVINLGGGEKPTDLNTIIKGIENRLGKNAVIEGLDFHKADIKETSADISKAKRLLGWQPKIKLEEGLDRTVAWHNQNKDWLGDVKL